MNLSNQEQFKFCRIGVVAMVVAGTLGLTGCAAITHRNLDVETKTSNSVFLPPVAPKLRTVFVEIHNTSGKKINITQQVKSSIKESGYKILNDPTKSHYLLQVNIRQVGKLNQQGINAALSSGYGGALQGALIAGTATSAFSNTSSSAVVGAGLAGAAIGGLANALVKDVTYGMITDVQVSAHTKNLVKTTTNAGLQQGTSTYTTTHSSGSSHYQRYRTRIVSTADQVNLKFADAKGKLAADLASSIAGMF